jgi:hypothetical protein
LSVDNLGWIDMGLFSPAQVSALTPRQLAPIPVYVSVWDPLQNQLVTQLDHYDSRFNALSADQIGEMASTQIPSISPSLISELAVTQIQAFTPAQIPFLTSAQVQKLPLGILTDAQRAALTPAQMKANPFL